MLLFFYIFLNDRRVLLLSTSCFDWYGIHKIFQLAQKAHVTGLDLVLNYENKDYWDGEYVLSLSQEFSVPVLSITAPEKGVNEGIIDEIIELAKKLDTQVVNFVPPHITDKKTKWFKDYLPKVKKHSGLSIAVQNVEPKFWLFVIPEYKNATFAQIKNITGDTTLDLGGVDPASGMDIMRAQKELGTSMKNILLSDRSATETGLLPWDNREGILPLESLLMKLKDTSYAWFITLKVDAKKFSIGDDEKTLEHLKKIKISYLKYFSSLS